KKNASHICVGLDNNNNKFRVNLADLKQGGIISGAIGTGKTTLRLTLMEQLIQKGITILDIDYKGDAPRLYKFFREGQVLVPGKNLHIDIFDQPSNTTTIEFVGILFRSFVESVSDGELTPPQRHILLDALRKTVVKRGNLESFYRNIIIASVESKEIIDNYQQQTAIALINKFNWLQSTMRNVFGVYGQSISAADLAHNNVFLDLSYIQHSAPNNHIRFFLDILITKLMLHYKSQDSENFSQTELPLRKVIFLDETHMFMPNHRDQNISRLEELVVTLRHKGLSVIATTTNPILISNVFLDSSFLAQFRTESSVMQRSLGLNNSDFKSIVQLPNYSYYLKSGSTNHELSELKTIQFLDNNLTLDEYNEALTKYDVNYLDEFRIEPGYFEVALLESYIFDSLPIEPYRRIIRPIAKIYLRKYFKGIEKNYKENGYHQFLLQSYTNYMDDESVIPELQDKFYMKCFLYELLLLSFQYSFRKAVLEKVVKGSRNKNFRSSYKVIFLNLIVFIDEFIEKQSINETQTNY
ncbi:MAG: helicase HerA-like domain-containing protein, partial [Candidatus Heimdallarchaeota archaeon]